MTFIGKSRRRARRAHTVPQRSAEPLLNMRASRQAVAISCQKKQPMFARPTTASQSHGHPVLATRKLQQHDAMCRNAGRVSICADLHQGVLPQIAGLYFLASEAKALPLDVDVLRLVCAIEEAERSRAVMEQSRHDHAGRTRIGDALGRMDIRILI